MNYCWLIENVNLLSKEYIDNDNLLSFYFVKRTDIQNNTS